MELRGRTAVITGASTGIGRAIAGKLAEAGCRLGICARTEASLEKAASELRAAGAQVVAIPTDVSREAEVERFAGTVERELGRAEVLVNNAGVGRFGSFLDLTPDEFDRTFATNVRGPFLCSQRFIPGMVEAGDGVVVNIASLAGKHPFRTGSVYAASKHALLGMSASMMLDLREHGVRVLSICPGSVDTPFFGKESHRTSSGTKILAAEDVAELVLTAIRLSDRGTVSEVEIRPIDP
jgi:3-oxoacyl-[acyl-carrier protein] reductase